ncbi:MULTISPECIES: YhfC family glutamic-type intramembrane protease [unclassified Sporosarcina]|uniref:YhfC family glutamic-type intramembrane protease n=1 Tax=unclassified Sporosarcina TaxID=2647733 RepID=UPI00203F9D69|nr:MULTISPECIES: YhfC family glutamic-type intramembrane protease [unclassified Sporosarcina]GKV67397.1 CAAX amino protease [Sporosarcina sp. NCCP-2331]GLB57753.1 CAAX amino protease [Sporosarcina sp. NCCP-2378]
MAGILFASAVGLLLPAGLFIASFLKKQWLPYVLGILAFIVSQVLIRLPLLSYLSVNSTEYMMLSALHPLLYAVFLGVTAGLAEELARYAAMRYFMKQRQWQSGLFFGAGHGGVEALLLFGLPAVSYLFTTATPIGTGLYFIGGMERIFAILLHIGLSLLVLQSVRQKKWRFLLAAIIIHTMIDAMIGIVPLFVAKDLQLLVMETLIGLLAVGLFLYGLRMKRKGGWT